MENKKTKKEIEGIIKHFQNTIGKNLEKNLKDICNSDAKQLNEDIKMIKAKSKKEFGHDIYSIRYKYGYNWGCYQNLAVHLIQMMANNKENNKNIIDVGCGVGWFTDMVYFNISRNICGVDFSKLAILFHARRMYPTIHFDIDDIYTYDYRDFEVAILTEVLEHIDNDIELLSKLPKGCTVYATVPFEKDRMDITHVREYSIDSTMKRYGDIMKFKTCEKFEQYIVICGVIK